MRPISSGYFFCVRHFARETRLSCSFALSFSLLKVVLIFFLSLPNFLWLSSLLLYLFFHVSQSLKSFFLFWLSYLHFFLPVCDLSSLLCLSLVCPLACAHGLACSLCLSCARSYNGDHCLCVNVIQRPQIQLNFSK